MKAYLIFAEQEAPDRVEVDLPQSPRRGETIHYEERLYEIKRVVYAVGSATAQIHLFLSPGR
jgi:hypothetical protein